jgi:peptide/nickel transport system substrate-binding protein
MRFTRARSSGAAGDTRTGHSRRRISRALSVGTAIAAGSVALAACGGSSSNSGSSKKNLSSGGAAAKGLYGAAPATGGSPVSGGTLTFDQLQGSTPLYIMPIIPANDASVYGVNFFQDQMFETLYSSAPSATPSFDFSLSLGQKPVVSDGGKTLVINLNKDYTWSNGAPVDANDIIFDIDEIKAATKESPANFSDYTPGLFPDNLTSYTATGKYQVTLKLNKVYNPSFYLYDQLGDITPLPSTDWNVAAAGGPHLNYAVPANAKKIYDYLNKEASTLADWDKNPLWQDVDGPFKLKSFTPTNGQYTQVANPKYTGPDKPHIATLQEQVYTGITPLINAEKTGAVDIGTIDPSQLGQVSSVKSAGYSVFGYPDFGWTAAFFNFKDKTDDFDKVISQLYARQALDHLEDQAAYVTGVLKGAGGQAYGPVPAVPVTQFTPKSATNAPYPYSVAAAKTLLTSHGWKVVPNGVSTCQKPGTGAGECGAGIPKGTPFEFTWAYLTPTTVVQQSLESEAVASQAAKIGIKINLVSKAFNFLVQNYVTNNPADSKYDNDWGVNYFGGFTDDIYPTQNSIFNTGGSYNFGGYSSSATDTDINKSVYSANPDAVSTEATQLTTNLPALFFPNPDLVEAVSNKVGTPSAGAVEALTQYGFYPQLLWIKK